MGKLKGKKRNNEIPFSAIQRWNLFHATLVYIYIYIYILPQVNNLISQNDKDKSILTQVQNRPMYTSPK